MHLESLSRIKGAIWNILAPITAEILYRGQISPVYCMKYKSERQRNECWLKAMKLFPYWELNWGRLGENQEA